MQINVWRTAKRVGYVLVLSGACSFARGVTTAPATSAPVRPPRPAPPRVPLPIAVGDIATQAETVTIDIRGVEAGLASDPIVPYVTSDLPSLSDELDARLDESSKILQANPSLETLRTLDEDWHTLDKQLQDWKTQLARRSAWVHGKFLQLTALRNLWESEQRLGRDQRISADDEDHIDDTVDALDNTLKDTRARHDEINDLAEQVDGQDARAADVLSSLADARQQAYNRLLERDAAPLWRKPETTPVAASNSSDSLITQLKEVQAYLRRNDGRFLPHVLLLIGVTVALYWLRRRVDARAADNPQLAEAAPVFRAPISTALVIWFMVAVWIYPHAPRLFWAISGALALIPTVVLLSGLVARRLLPLLTALVVFYFVDQVRIVLAGQPVLSRWVFLGEMAFALLAVILLLRSARATDSAVGSPWIGRIIHGVTWLAAMVLVATVLGDIVGFVSLARLLGDATLRSAYLGLILYAALRIADALLVLAFNGWPLTQLKIVRKHSDIMLLRSQTFLEWVALVLWGLAVLQLFWVRDAVFAYGRAVLDRSIYGNSTLTPHKLLAFALIVWASFLVSRFIRFVLEEDVYGRFALPTGIPYATSKFLNYVILLAGFFMALAALGFNLSSFTILASAFTVGVGFGLQNIINNFVSGIILLFERPVKVGDVVVLDDAAGVVGKIGIRASVIRTTGGAEIIVPNAMFISSRVTNWTLSTSQRGIEVDVNVAAGPKPQDVIELLQRTASSQPLISESPRPLAMLAKFSGDTYSYELHVWTDRVENWMSIRSDLTVAISDALTKANIAIK